MNHDMYSSKLEPRNLMNHKTEPAAHKSYYSCIYKFRDIEDVISLAHRLPLPFFNTQLIRFRHFYYLAVLYPQERLMRRHDWGESLILEYGERSNESLYRLEEYGQQIFNQNAIACLRKHFALLK